MTKVEFQCDRCLTWFEVNKEIYETEEKFWEYWPYVDAKCPNCGTLHEKSFLWKNIKIGGKRIT